MLLLHSAGLPSARIPHLSGSILRSYLVETPESSANGLVCRESASLLARGRPVWFDVSQRSSVRMLLTLLAEQVDDVTIIVRNQALDPPSALS